MNPPVPATIALCLERNVHCLWTWASHVGIRTRRTLLEILMPCGSGTRWRWLMTRCVVILVRPFSNKSAFTINGLSDAVGDWTMRYYPPAKCKLDSPCVGPYLVVSLAGWAVGVQLQPDSPIILVHCQDLKKIPHPNGLVSWIDVALPEGLPAPHILGASTVYIYCAPCGLDIAVWGRVC